MEAAGELIDHGGVESGGVANGENAGDGGLGSSGEIGIALGHETVEGVAGISREETLVRCRSVQFWSIFIAH